MIHIGDIVYDIEKMKKADSLLIYGAGKTGILILDYLKVNDLSDRVKGFIDNYRYGSCVSGYKIYSLSDAEKMFPSGEILVGGGYAREMYLSLDYNARLRSHLIIV
ncbi:hypothetical protein SAMN04487928_11949 [Butyrivibrio proteoclasticus]|uniref:Uncharacterized protein n=1 Tax=Butyrivibrio proteoclasticus TaxID=43305 RepID=A0A1I5VW68_9FIRM|nr:hypothetical protein [Butyrivibrio proteoclasticus]SFQ11653.1 hypothetical protein SAMN04487928_11949 [Butyrivibrio proteoclasticus]